MLTSELDKLIAGNWLNRTDANSTWIKDASCIWRPVNQHAFIGHYDLIHACQY